MTTVKTKIDREIPLPQNGLTAPVCSGHSEEVRLQVDVDFYCYVSKSASNIEDLI